MLVTRNTLYYKCRRFPKTFFPPLYLHNVAIQRKFLLLFPWCCFIFLSLQVGRLFIVGCTTSGIKPCAFAAICISLTLWRESGDLHSAHVSSWNVPLPCLVKVELESKNDERDGNFHCRRHCQLCTYSSTMYFSWSRTSWILHEAHLNIWNSQRSPNWAVSRSALPCSYKYGPSSAKLSSSPGLLLN